MNAKGEIVPRTRKSRTVYQTDPQLAESSDFVIAIFKLGWIAASRSNEPTYKPHNVRLVTYDTSTKLIAVNNSTDTYQSPNALFSHGFGTKGRRSINEAYLDIKFMLKGANLARMQPMYDGYGQNPLRTIGSLWDIVRVLKYPFDIVTSEFTYQFNTVQELFDNKPAKIMEVPCVSDIAAYDMGSSVELTPPDSPVYEGDADFGPITGVNFDEFLRLAGICPVEVATQPQSKATLPLLEIPHSANLNESIGDDELVGCPFVVPFDLSQLPSADDLDYGALYCHEFAPGELERMISAIG